MISEWLQPLLTWSGFTLIELFLLITLIVILLKD